ncbi:hypothetical protein AAVH_01844 [Aphelenchoides avenae]|nr:hypothetical protein AAVH_01844 [Aphelenchus avenae]
MNICEELLCLLNTGTSAAFLFENFVALTQSKEFKSAAEFVNDCFPAFIKGASAKLSKALELYRHLLLAYEDDVQQILQEIPAPATNKKPPSVLSAVVLSQVMRQLGKKMQTQLNILTMVAEKNW